MMGHFVGLLRAINVGGTGKLSMERLRELCDELGFRNVKTYIQSGNVVFSSPLAEPKVQAKLSKALAAELGKPVGVMLRSAAELDQVLAHNPFAKHPPNRVIVLFLPEAPPKDALKDVKIPGSEELKLKGREIFIHYPEGMGHSKLKFKLMDQGTARNINSVTKLAAMAHALND